MPLHKNGLFVPDAPISYAITTGVFIGLGVILFAARTKRLSGQKKEAHIDISNEIKRSPA